MKAGLSPYDEVGGEPGVRALVQRFYAHMAAHERALTRTHKCDEQGLVAADVQDRFALFLMGWLGGPQTYTATHGHPRLRMRHGHVAIDSGLRDAWLRSMNAAIDGGNFNQEVVAHLRHAFAQMADFLRNVPDGASPKPQAM
ncbi:MAG: cyanoglobin [Deltaproteobacteria bacterium]|nr:cyanoglobin [Deltaproteobacteria bacterium]